MIAPHSLLAGDFAADFLTHGLEALEHVPADSTPALAQATLSDCCPFAGRTFVAQEVQVKAEVIHNRIVCEAACHMASFASACAACVASRWHRADTDTKLCSAASKPELAICCVAPIASLRAWRGARDCSGSSAECGICPVSMPVNSRSRSLPSRAKGLVCAPKFVRGGVQLSPFCRVPPA
jgi:hypothetical protein